MKLIGTNEEVAAAWLKGQPLTSHNGKYRTDGQNLWSYALQIGKRSDQGQPLLLNVRGLISPTTSNHISCALYVRENPSARNWSDRGELIQPQATLVRPRIADHLASITRYSFPENPEEFDGWIQNPAIIRYTPKKLRTDFSPSYVEINDKDYFAKLKLPKTTLSAFIPNWDDDHLEQRDPLHKYSEFWISDDCWNYLPGLREERVHIREITYDPDTDDADRQIFCYFLTQPGGSMGEPQTYIYKFRTGFNGQLLLEYIYDDYLRVGHNSHLQMYTFVNPLMIYRGGINPNEYPLILRELGGTLNAPIRIVERDTDSYQKMRERLAKEA